MISKDFIKGLLRENLNQPLFNDAFKIWFGSSKVVDSSGMPLVCYHGSSKNITKFMGKYSAQGVFWFTSDKNKILSGQSGAAGTSTIIPVFLSASKIAGWPEYEKLGLGQLQDMGYEAVKLDDDFIIFDATRIKSINNVGTWDRSNKNIKK